MLFSNKTTKTSCGGASLIEFGILAGLISIVSIAAVISVGEEIKGSYVATASALGDSRSEGSQAETSEPETPEALAMVEMFTDTYTYNGTSYIGWQDVSPAWGSMTDSSSDVYEISALFSMSDSSSIIKLYGDHTETDFSNIDLVCDHGRWPLSEVTRRFDTYRSRTELKWSAPGEYPVFVDGASYKCTVDRVAAS
jgi:Flp pilus assembly pilin Flp